MKWKIAPSWTLLMAALFAVLAGCASPPAEPPTESALLPAVKAYLVDEKGIDIDRMEITLSEVAIEKGQATCTGTLSLKEPAGQMPPIVYLYTLAKEGSAWKVTSSSPAPGAPQHGAVAHDGPAPMKGHAQAPQMPAGHPPISSANPHAQDGGDQTQGGGEESE